MITITPRRRGSLAAQCSTACALCGCATSEKVVHSRLSFSGSGVNGQAANQLSLQLHGVSRGTRMLSQEESL
eukprot:m.202911 g.202911  ORF g.202911 m.202911 type:complete len:72 (-) comp25255_c0_seq1:47-262(-)